MTQAPSPAAQIERMTGAEALIRALEACGVDTVFGYPGGAIMPVYDALTGSSIRHILTRHEQGAALAADGYGRVTGKPGVCLATSGPGATNLVTGIANAFLDSVPMVAITGQVARPLMGTDAFQEVDIFGITLPVVKHSYLVRDPDELVPSVFEAFRIAASGRPGPVLIDLPKDVTQCKIDYHAGDPAPDAPPAAPEKQVAAARELLAASHRPLVYIGGGVGISDSVEALRDFVDATGSPAVATLKALGALPTDHPLFLGMLGMHGTPAANAITQQADLLITVGARFDDRATGRLDGFAPRADVIHLDIDPAEVGKLRRADIELVGDLGDSLTRLVPPLLDTGRWGLWRQHCAEAREGNVQRYDAPGTGIYAPALLRDLSIKAGPEAIISCDVGQHQMWVAQHCRISHPRRHLTSGGLGTMGFGIPAAIGAKLAEPERPVIAVSGDGSLMMNIQELATLRRYGIDIKVVVIDNSALGMVRQWQELFFEGNYSEIDLSDNPDFAELSRAFGIHGMTIRHRSEVDAGLDELLATPGPALLHVPIDMNENVWPLVPPGKTNDQMMTAEGETP
ncbi:MAG: acetolactate synthase 2 catalytic subunit [Candidatus Competibacterales bacterium]|nr:acetolactate synthase 2 catalytic subunit [Candidatus Competibacterales bacterium]